MIRDMTVFVPRHQLLRERDSFPREQVEQFERLTGIKKTRRYRGPTQDFLALALEAAVTYGSIPRNIRGVIVVTQSPDRLSPCLAMWAHGLLNLKPGAFAFDVNQSCDGFVYGLWLASQVAAGEGGPVLLVCVDRLRYGFGTVEEFIFSDAAVVAVVGAELAKTGMSMRFLNDPDGQKFLYSKLDGEMLMQGGAVFDFVTRHIPPMLSGTDADFLCQHQSNESMMRLVDRRAGYQGRSLYSIEEYGNQSMCGIPTALAYNERKILGKRVLLAGYGAGFCAAVAEFRWPESPVCHIIEEKQ